MLTPAQEECFTNVSQEFLICTTIHKARQLHMYTGETYVRVSLDKSHKSTKSFANSENPYYNEYFVFELKCTLSELLRLTILYEVKKRTTCKKNATIGELLIDMQSVWNQPSRCYFKKWGRLESPIGSNNLAQEPGKGYLQIDLAIVSQATNASSLLRPFEGEMMGMNKWQINQDFDDIDKNMLQNMDTGVECNIRYSVTFYRGYMLKRGDYIIQFRFHPFKGKTSASKSTLHPEWNQEVSFAWTFPSLAQTFLIQLLSHEHLQWKNIAECELHFDEIAFKDKPSLGPTYLHLYDNLNAVNYVGRLLVEVRSDCMMVGPMRELVARPVAPIDEKRWWQEEKYVVEFVALQGDFLHGNISNCKITMRVAEFTSNQNECLLKSYSNRQNASGLLKYFKQEVPYKSVYLKLNLPDNRHKFDSDFFLLEILEYMKAEVETFKLFQLKYSYQFHMQRKCLKAIIISILNKIKDGVDDKRLEYAGFKDPTPWDTNRLIFLQDYIHKFPAELRTMRQKLKSVDYPNVEHVIEEVMQDLLRCSNELANVLGITRLQDEWPDLFLILSVSGGKEIGICRLNAKYFLNPIKDRDASPNNWCWRVRNFIFKDINCQHSCVNCGCNVGIIQGCLGIVVDGERTNYLNSIVQHWKETEPFYWGPTTPYTIYKCRIFIHQAKVRPGSDRSGLCDAHVRVILGGQSAETPTEHATLSPIWNLVICFEGIIMPGTIDWYMQSPPLVVIELYDTDKHTADDFLGCGMTAVSVITSDIEDANAREESESMRKNVTMGKAVRTRNAFQKFQQLKTLSPPPLKWVPVAQKGAVRAEVLMSAELVETNGGINKSFEVEPTITYGIPNGIKPNMRNFVLEVVFIGFRNYSKSTFAGSRHCIKLMMGDLMLKSGLSSSRIKNSINFLVLYASGVVSLPEQLEYWPAIIATDVAVSGRGNETTIGAVLIPNSKQFLAKDHKVKCEPQIETDAESTVASTTLHFNDEDETEKSPLLSKVNRNSFFGGLFDGLKANKKHTPQKHLKVGTFDPRQSIKETEYNWWSKFYNSIYMSSSDDAHNYKHRLVIYTSELEKQGEFSYMHDWAEPVKLVHGIKYKKNSVPKEEIYATLKLHLKISQCQCSVADCGDGAMLQPLAASLNPKYQAQLQSLAELCKIVVRVYVVQGIQFRPHDKHTQSDSYVKLQLGTRSATNRAHYVANQSNPIFGKCFQLEGLLPREHMLEVSVFDRNTLCDEIIGSTFVDLEDRWRTKHRATVGISNEYSKNGYNKWRDMATPQEILTEYCLKREIKPPKFMGQSIEVDGVVFEDETQIATDEDLHERLSLTALKNFDKVPSFGYKLVPEHVETRPLYRTDCPGIEQGKIQLWIELYEGNINIPPIIDITPQPPQLYELRVVIHNCTDIAPDDQNIFGKKMSDLFIKGWCHDTEQVQSTDVHYRSFNGEGMFNWRMVFPVKYSAVEDMMVIKRKGGLLEEYETKQPPILYLQVWDNDLISYDDLLGSLEINLSNFPEPYSSRSACTLPESPGYKFHLPFSGPAGGEPRKPINLFRQRTAKGWFPFRGQTKQKKKGSAQTFGMTGKVELELEILSDAEAIANPVGMGRNPPNALAEPARPDTSFNPLLHPLKGLKTIILPGITKYMIYLLLAVLVVFMIVMFFMKLPYVLLGLA